MSQTTNSAGLQLIESFEGLRLTSYQDSVRRLTIGYGHTTKVCIRVKLLRSNRPRLSCNKIWALRKAQSIVSA